MTHHSLWLSVSSLPAWKRLASMGAQGCHKLQEDVGGGKVRALQWKDSKAKV